MAEQPHKRYSVTRIVAGHEGDLEAALNELGDGGTFQLHGLANGDLLLIADAGSAPATADEPAQPVAS
jgi:hypothetical protein